MKNQSWQLIENPHNRFDKNVKFKLCSQLATLHNMEEHQCEWNAAFHLEMEQKFAAVRVCGKSQKEKVVIVIGEE